MSLANIAGMSVTVYTTADGFQKAVQLHNGEVLLGTVMTNRQSREVVGVVGDTRKTMTVHVDGDTKNQLFTRLKHWVVEQSKK